jgi:hypothetical protein
VGLLLQKLTSKSNFFNFEAALAHKLLMTKIIGGKQLSHYH